MLEIHFIDSERGQLQYKNLLQDLQCTEPHYIADYIQIFAHGIQNLICFSYTGSSGRIIMPGYLNKITIDGVEDREYYDFSTPYGYTGPLTSKNITEDDVRDFWAAVDKWYQSNNVVSEFIRFNLFGNHFNYSGEVHTTMLNIKGIILNDEVEQWSAFDRKVRKNYNKAQREGLTSQVFYGDIPMNKIEEFYHIYIDTMERTNANAQFFYSLEQFVKFINSNKEYAAVCTVYDEEVPVSSELLLVSHDSIFSFLGGTLDACFDKRPNDFLKVEALNWARSQGKKYYVLGGGYGYEDGIFKYKKAFFPNDVVSYYTGRKIINQALYDLLVEKISDSRVAKGQEKISKEDNSFFPLYRMPEKTE